jgi:glutaredoxin
VSALQLLVRRDCHLCEQAAATLKGLAVSFEAIDIDADQALRAEYDEVIPVLLADGVEIARAPLSPASIRKAVDRAGYSPSRRS